MVELGCGGAEGDGKVEFCYSIVGVGVAEYVWGRDKDQAPGKGMHSIWETYTLDPHGSDRSARSLQLDVYGNGMEMLSR